MIPGKRFFRRRICTIFFMLVAVFMVPTAAADLSRFDGLWVVDIEPSAQAWKKAGNPMDEATYAVLSGHSMRLDFTKGTIIEGIVIGHEKPEEPFTVTEKEKDVYALEIDGRRKRTFLWRVQDDNHIILSAPNGESPPLYFLRENLLPYSGLWKVTNVDAALAGIEKAMGKTQRRMTPEGKERTRKILQSMRMRIDFDGKTVSWEDEKGGRLYGGPSGGFLVADRQEKSVRLVFDRDKPTSAFRMLGPDRISMTDRGIWLEMVRVLGKGD